MFVVDLMHEFELGVWKSTFIHLIRMVVCTPGNLVQEFNLRYRKIPRFGRSTIRRITENTSALKKLAARDYEDFLQVCSLSRYPQYTKSNLFQYPQCAMPVFEGLFPERAHNKEILDVLFALAEWHALAKLRLHTETTLELLRAATTTLGSRLRHFVNHVCPLYDTRELPKEEAARARRRKRKAKDSAQPPPPEVVTVSSGPKQKILNLLTYKLHALGDYVTSIQLFGTSNSYSTQPVSLTQNLCAYLLTHSHPGRTRTSTCEEILHPNQQKSIRATNRQARAT